MELVNITYSGEGKQPVELTPSDSQLVTSNFINSTFGDANDYMELFIYDQSGQLLDQDYDAFDYYPFLLNNPQNNTYSALTLDPERDLKNRGFIRGALNTQYNFYKKLFNSQFGSYYWIKEISTSRTELKLASQTIANTQILEGFNSYQAYVSTKNYYPVFYLNFGNNTLVTSNNVAYTEDDQGAYLLIKLYEPLPTEFDIKTQLWIVDKVAESISFDVDIQVQVEESPTQNALRGPNFNVRLNTKNGQTTPYYNYNNLLASPVTSSYQKLLSYYQDKSVEINVDYSNFSNFIHWSSAVERVNNFVYKLQLIESSSADLVAQQAIIGGPSSVSIASSSIGAIQSYIDNIIQNFDTYEYFLYFNSSSWAWPKSTTTQPYSLYSVTSSIAQNFLGGINAIPTSTTQSLLWSASYYDATNKDLLHNSIPQYLLDDPSNQPYITFIDMIGQHFDNIWIYYKDLANRYNATNNPQSGISLDVVSDALRNFGIQLYTNTNVSDNLYYTLFGINQDGSLLPPTGSEIITNYITSSLTTLPAQTIQDEIYKRLYHNLPYLLKTKGTERGVKALIATYGIPDSILTVREFGGNFINSVDGVFDLDTSEYKIAIATGSNGNVTGSLTLSSSLLSPYTTIQYYEKNHRVNSTNVEIGFSPADVINNNVVSSEGYFSIDQLIGKPSDQYSSSYQPLVSASNAYFSTYTEQNSIWEYIRLLKFYNNSIFKLVKDFVPARANVSTGLIVKSHMYERNKYARHEPNFEIENNYSQSIDMASISGSEAGAISDSTYWTGFVMSTSGSVPYTSSQNIELYNGEFSGSTIVVTDGYTFTDQFDISSISVSGGYFVTYSLGALYQNVTESVNSQYFFDLDYNGDQIKPVNYNAVTYSLSQSQVNNYESYNNPNNPYAQLQDYNYALERSIIPRYRGSKVESKQYNVYTDGDDSYGKTAAIDKGKYQYAYLIDIYTASLFFPNRSNAQIKYLIDNDENVLDLTKANTNIFEVQNVFKSQQQCDIGLFKYDELNPYSQLLANNPTQTIYEGGFRYLPILHNVSGSTNSTPVYTLNSPIEITVQGNSNTPPATNETDPNNYVVEYWSTEIDYTGGYSAYFINLRAYFNGPALSEDVTLQVSTLLTQDGTCGTARTFNITISQGQTIGFSSDNIVSIPPPAPGSKSNSTGNGSGSSTPNGTPNHWPPSGVSKICNISIISLTGGSAGGGGGSTPFVSTFLTTTVTGSTPCLYYLSESKEIVFNSAIAFYYNNSITFNSTSDNNWATSTLERVVVPFTLNTGDKISLYDASSLGWDERWEYTVQGFYITGSGATGSRLIAQLDRPVNAAILVSGSGIPVDPFTGSPYRVCRFIVWKHVPDETNVMLRFNPKDTTITEEGLLFPQYIDPLVKQNSGNIIKALRSQNLLPPSP